VTDIR